MLAFFKPVRDKEVPLDKVQFTVHKFNNRPKPSKIERIRIISCFSEFGCEIFGCMYCIPRLLSHCPGHYVVAMGWRGRAYLYRHLVDEFWEIDEDCMWLRDYTRAFHNTSFNLKKIEEAATAYGHVVPAASLGKYAVCNYCRTCGKFWSEWRKRTEKCPACASTVLVRSVFTDIAAYKPKARKMPRPCEEKMEWARSILGPNPVGVFARSRKTYGRNLPPEFYVKLIKLLEDRGHSVIWLGEKESVLPCPVDHVLDFSRMAEANDLEKTLAIVSCLDFTVQFWTASTRLAGMMGVPFLLFESPEQIYTSYSGLMGAQEGKRLELCSFGPKKLVISHYRNVLENPDEALETASRAMDEMREGNWNDLMGQVQDAEFSAVLQEEHYGLLT